MTHIQKMKCEILQIKNIAHKHTYTLTWHDHLAMKFMLKSSRQTKIKPPLKFKFKISTHIDLLELWYIWVSEVSKWVVFVAHVFRIHCPFYAMEIEYVFAANEYAFDAYFAMEWLFMTSFGIFLHKNQQPEKVQYKNTSYKWMVLVHSGALVFFLSSSKIDSFRRHFYRCCSHGEKNAVRSFYVIQPIFNCFSCNCVPQIIIILMMAKHCFTHTHTHNIWMCMNLCTMYDVYALKCNRRRNIRTVAKHIVTLWDENKTTWRRAKKIHQKSINLSASKWCIIHIFFGFLRRKQHTHTKKCLMWAPESIYSIQPYICSIPHSVNKCGNNNIWFYECAFGMAWHTMLNHVYW